MLLFEWKLRSAHVMPENETYKLIGRLTVAAFFDLGKRAFRAPIRLWSSRSLLELVLHHHNVSRRSSTPRDLSQ